MGFRFELRPEQRLGQRFRLTAELRHELKYKQAQVLLQLTQAIHGRSYQSRGTCPGCRNRLTPREILEGFLPNPTDTTTRCPRCECRFQPLLIASAWSGSQIEVNFLCADQALHVLADLDHQTPEMIQHNHASAYQSALVHFGSLRAAFAHMGITYTLEDLHGWKTKMIPFLGQIPDSVIAKIVGVSATTISKMRRREGFSPYCAIDHV